MAHFRLATALALFGITPLCMLAYKCCHQGLQKLKFEYGSNVKCTTQSMFTLSTHQVYIVRLLQNDYGYL